MEDRFFTDSLRIVRRFLSTAIVVDDQAYFPESVQPEGDLVAPSYADAADSAGTPEQAPSEVEVPRPNLSLDANLLTRGFAAHSILCTVLRPESADAAALGQASILGRRADLVILDWQLKNAQGIPDNGEQIINVIAEVTSQQPGCPQLIAIYTGDPDFARIPDVLVEAFPKAQKQTFDWMDTALVSLENVWIAIFPKMSIPEAELPEMVITTFCHVTHGLLANFAIEALAVLRQHTYPLLSTLSRELDIAYIYDRGVRHEPDDAISVIGDLLVAEIRSLLEDARIDAPEKAREQIESFWQRLKDVPVSVKSNTFSMRELMNGFMSADWPSGLFTKNNSLEKKGIEYVKLVLQQLTDLTGESIEAAITELSRLATLKRRYLQAQAPVLTLGTIVYVKQNDPELALSNMLYPGFWVCVQPRCDSVRIPDEGRAFPFLPCEVVPRDHSNPIFDLVVTMPGEKLPQRLKLNRSLFHCRMLLFRSVPGENAVVAQAAEDDRFFFAPIETSGFTLEWVAEVKYEHAQRIAEMLGNQVSRVGLNETEWQRKYAVR